MWITIRDFLLPPSMLAMRTAGPKWKHAKFHGSFAAFFLMGKSEDQKGESGSLPEWPSLCGNLRQRFDYYESEICPMTGSVFGHFMRNRDDLCLIVKKGAQKATQSLISRAVVFLCCAYHFFSSFSFFDCSQTIYFLLCVYPVKSSIHCSTRED